MNPTEKGSFAYILEALDNHPCTAQNPAFKNVIMNMLAARWPGWQAVREEAEAERVASRLRLSHEKLQVTCQKVNKCLVEGEKVAMSLLTSYENNQLLAAIQSLGPGD